MKPIILTALIVIVFSCTNHNRKSHSSSRSVINDSIQNQNLHDSAITHTKLKKLGDFISDTEYYFWSAKMSDRGNYWIRLNFQEEFAEYQFHGQCVYWFFTNYYYTGTDKIELLWSYKTDCVLSMDFLRKSNGVKKYPKPRDAFCEYKLVNDLVIAVKYNFPEWVDRVNKIAKDSIFPRYLYLNKEDDK